MIHPLPPSAWVTAEGSCVARIALPEGVPCVVWTEGWDTATAALALAGTTRFTQMARGAVAAAFATGGTLLLRAMRPPERGVAIACNRGSPTLAMGWPRTMRPRTAAGPQALAPDAVLVARLLEDGETDTLLALLGEALLGGAAREAVTDAARSVFLYRARHPLAPDPGLAPLLAALAAPDIP